MVNSMIVKNGIPVPDLMSINDYLSEIQKIFVTLDKEIVELNVSLLYGAWKQRRHVFIIGNGGSASTASHMANDLSKATIIPGLPRMKVIALTDNISIITAWANDTSFENIFKEQLENLLEPEDMVLGISASGNSPNILRALEFARRNAAVTVGWTGNSGGAMKDMVDLAWRIPTDNVGLIESCHLFFDHLVTTELCKRLWAEFESGKA